MFRDRRQLRRAVVLPHSGMLPNGPGIASTEPALHRSYEAGLSYYLRQVLECVSFWAEPYGGKEIVLGEIADGGAAGRCERWRLE
jgi:hypothetical protein